jgi:hypothetical protein
VLQLTNTEIYPNPNNGSFKIHFEWEELGHKNVIFEIYDVLGKRVDQINLSTSNGKIDAIYNGGKLKPGVYFVSLKNVKKACCKKIVVIQ